MKNIINFILTSLIVFFISSTSLAQTDTTGVDSVEFQLDAKFYSAQVEACVLILGGEVGGLVDIDLLSNKRTQNQFIGLRFAVELYGYGDIGGGSDEYSDICVYGRASLRFNNFRVNGYGGLAFHTENSGAWDNDNRKILPRGGLEAKYFPFGNFVAIMLKGSSSFKKDSGFFGIGIALGYYN